MPCFAIFAAAAQVRNREHPALFEPRKPCRAEPRRLRNIEPAVAIKERWRWAFVDAVFAPHDKHRHARAIL